MFAEVIRAGSTQALGDSKKRWMKAALAESVPSSAFEVFEWCGGSLNGRVQRLTSYVYDRRNPGRVECRDGIIEFYGDKRHGHRNVIEHYRDWGARTNADLMWLVFIRNCSGITWCQLKEYADRSRRGRSTRRTR